MVRVWLPAASRSLWQRGKQLQPNWFERCTAIQCRPAAVLTNFCISVCSTNKVAGTAAVSRVDHVKLYLGCAATGMCFANELFCVQHCAESILPAHLLHENMYVHASAPWHRSCVCYRIMLCLCCVVVCAGTVTLSVLSKGASDTGMLIKTVTKPVKALSACPLSPCQTSTPAPSSPAPATVSNNNGALNLTGNPMVSHAAHLACIQY